VRMPGLAVARLDPRVEGLDLPIEGLDLPIESLDFLLEIGEPGFQNFDFAGELVSPGIIVQWECTGATLQSKTEGEVRQVLCGIPDPNLDLPPVSGPEECHLAFASGDALHDPAVEISNIRHTVAVHRDNHVSGSESRLRGRAVNHNFPNEGPESAVQPQGCRERPRDR